MVLVLLSRLWDNHFAVLQNGTVGVLGGGAPVQRLTSGKMTRVGTFPLCLLLQV